MLPTDLDLPRILAIALIFAMWGLYGPILSALGRGTLNAQLHVVRMRWMRMLLQTHRDHRAFDALMMGHISNSMAFFGSATLLVLAGLLGTLANISRLYAAVMEIKFVPIISLELFTIYFVALTVIMAICFFSFTYALRKLAYTLAMIGGLSEAPGDDPQSKIMVVETATVMTEAVKSLNNGIRGYYFALAAFFLFVGPYACMVMTAAMSGLLLYRQGFSTTALGHRTLCRCDGKHEEITSASDWKPRGPGLLIPAQSPASINFFGTIQEPPTVMTLGSFKYFGADSRVIPPVGQKRICGRGEAREAK